MQQGILAAYAVCFAAVRSSEAQWKLSGTKTASAPRIAWPDLPLLLRYGRGCELAYLSSPAYVICGSDPILALCPQSKTPLDEDVDEASTGVRFAPNHEVFQGGSRSVASSAPASSSVSERVSVASKLEDSSRAAAQEALEGLLSGNERFRQVPAFQPRNMYSTSAISRSLRPSRCPLEGNKSKVLRRAPLCAVYQTWSSCQR